ncbi:MAG: glycosyltransferase family 39 protein [Candidatus Levybacteria bacterium]|nr:glycosyltransferase family 39 protein [Candidatus Levybacteria bacterium]
MEKMAHILSFKTPGKIRLSLDLVALCAILLLGFFLRIYKIKDYIIFLGDEGRDVLVVYEILHGNLTLLGPTSSVGGFFLGPIYYYFMTPFLFLSNYDPVGPAIMVVLFGIATIYFVYRLGREFFGKEAGLIAALLYAVSPIVITYSRSSWNPNVFPFFTIASLYVLYKAVSKSSLLLFVLAGVLMGINLQIHYLATFVGVIMFSYVLLSDFKPQTALLIKLVKQYVLMFIGFLIGFAPFLAFELRHQFTNTQNIINFIFHSSETGAGNQFFLNIRHVFERLFGGLLTSFPTFNNFTKFDPNIIQIWLAISMFLGLVSTIFFLILFIKSRSDKKQFQKYLLIFVWGALGIGLFGLYKKSIYDYYLGFLFPLPFLLVGLLFSETAVILKRYGGIFVFGLVAILVLINLKFSPITAPGNNQVIQIKSISDFVLSKTNGAPFNFALITGGNSDHAYRYFFKLAERDPVTILNSDIDPKRDSVTSQLMVVCETAPCKPLGNSLWEIAGFGRAEIAGQWDVSVLKVYKLIHYEEE